MAACTLSSVSPRRSRRLGRSSSATLGAAWDLEGRFGREATGEQAQSGRWDRLPNYSRYVRVNLLEKEGADHTRLRRLVSAALDPRRVRELRGRIEGLVAELLDGVTHQG